MTTKENPLASVIAEMEEYLAVSPNVPMMFFTVTKPKMERWLSILKEQQEHIDSLHGAIRFREALMKSAGITTHVCHGIEEACQYIKEQQEQTPPRLSLEHQVMRERLIGRPDWKCVKCGHFASGSGNWPCPSCGERHYWTGGFEWPVDTPKAKEWLAKHTGILDAWLEREVATLSLKESTTQPQQTLSTPSQDQSQEGAPRKEENRANP